MLKFIVFDWWDRIFLSLFILPWIWAGRGDRAFTWTRHCLWISALVKDREANERFHDFYAVYGPWRRDCL